MCLEGDGYMLMLLGTNGGPLLGICSRCRPCRHDLPLETSLSACWFPSLAVPKVIILKAISTTKFHGSHASYQTEILFPFFSLSVQTHFLIFYSRLFSSILPQ